MEHKRSAWKLVVHPNVPGPSSTDIEATMEWSGATGLEVCFRVSGNVASLRIPQRVGSIRQDGLWKHTCFELFLLYPDSSYIEFNFAPSTQWAAYCFQSYRDTRSELALNVHPEIGMKLKPTELQLRVVVDLSTVLSRVRVGALKASLSAVIEDSAGNLSYWAISHSRDKPDFHHPDSFVATLPVMSAE